MKTLLEQISNKCVHFNGVMNDCCKKGVLYASVRVGKPYMFPCLNQGGECSERQFLTADEVKERESEINDMSEKALKNYATIKLHIKNTADRFGKVECVCGGRINYYQSNVNGHIAYKCSACGISVME